MGLTVLQVSVMQGSIVKFQRGRLPARQKMGKYVLNEVPFEEDKLPM